LHGKEEPVANCPDPKLITEPKTFHIQSISIPFDLRDSCRFLRLPDLLQSLAPAIILPTNAPGGYGDHIFNYLGFLRSFVGGKLYIINSIFSIDCG
jgi:hypothetical protein